MIRDVLIENELQNETAQSVGTLTLVYNHHQREEKLTEYQHRHLNATNSNGNRLTE